MIQTMRTVAMVGPLVASQFLFVHGAVGMETKEGGFISGLKPHQRPENAPIIMEVSKDHAWYAKALTGISQPFPNSLRFLDDQGNWYTPFNRPGMTGCYDIRGWHQQTK